MCCVDLSVMLVGWKELPSQITIHQNLTFPFLTAGGNSAFGAHNYSGCSHGNINRDATYQCILKKVKVTRNWNFYWFLFFTFLVGNSLTILFYWPEQEDQ